MEAEILHNLDNDPPLLIARPQEKLEQLVGGEQGRG